MRQVLETKDFVPAINWNECGSGRGWGRCVYETIFSLFADEYSCVNVFGRTIYRHPESIVTSAAAIASPCCFYFYGCRSSSLNLSWALVSLAVIFPLTMTLGAAFNRREAALVQMSNLKASIMSIFLAHKDWDWWMERKDGPAESGRSQGFKDNGEELHVTKVYNDIVRLIAVIASLLNAPTVTRARHSHTKHGRAERDEVYSKVAALQTESSVIFHRLSLYDEDLKRAGLPAGEATRIRQFSFTLISAWNQLLVLKQYRTPEGLREFSRIYIVASTIIFGPYYAQLASDTGLAFTIALSLVTTIAMQGLFNLRYELEDPFNRSESHDTVHVMRELQTLHDELTLHRFGGGQITGQTTCPAQPPPRQPESEHSQQLEPARDSDGIRVGEHEIRTFATGA